MQAPLSSTSNPRLPMLFRVLASVEWLVLGVTGFGLFLLPTVARDQDLMRIFMNIVLENQHVNEGLSPRTMLKVVLVGDVAKI